ncbi:MAG: hypothetical protein AAFU73_12235 [Planctomycetota bacterium]
MDGPITLEIGNDPEFDDAIDAMRTGRTVLLIRNGEPVAGLVDPEALQLLDGALDEPLVPEALLEALTSEPPEGSPELEPRSATDAEEPEPGPDALPSGTIDPGDPETLAGTNAGPT